MLRSYSCALVLLGGRPGLAPTAEQPVEDEPRVDLLGHRRRFRPPRDVRRVGAAVARVAVARLAAALDAQLKRGQPRATADRQSRHLVGRDPHLDVRAVGLVRVGAGQERGERPSVVAGAVAERLAVVLGQAAEDQQVVLESAPGVPESREARSPCPRPSASSLACGRRWARRRRPFAWGRRSLPPMGSAAEAAAPWLPARAKPGPRPFLAKPLGGRSVRLDSYSAPYPCH